MKRCFMCTCAHEENGNYCVHCDGPLRYAEEQEDDSDDVSEGRLITIGGTPGGISLHVANGVSEDDAIEMLKEAIRIIKAFK